MEKKLNECVGGGGFDPSVLEEIEAEISVLGSENAAMAQDIIDIKGSLNSINDNLTILPSLTQIGTTGVFYRVYNRIVEIFIETPSITVSNSGTTIATLPATVPKPPRDLVESAGNTLNPNTYPNIQIKIMPDGKILGLSYITTPSISVVAHITYLA
jgi:hypothetical protein